METKLTTTLLNLVAILLEDTTHVSLQMNLISCVIAEAFFYPKLKFCSFLPIKSFQSGKQATQVCQNSSFANWFTHYQQN